MTWLLMGWKAVQGAVGFVARYPWPAAVLALLCACGWLWLGNARLASDNKALAREIVTQRAEFVAKSEEAGRLAKAAKEATEQRYRTLAQRTDDETQTALADARSRADGYARRMSAKTICVPPGQAPAAPGGDYPEGGDGPGADADLVALTRPDFDTLIENTIRLNEVHKWALALNQGPIPEPTFGATPSD